MSSSVSSNRLLNDFESLSTEQNLKFNIFGRIYHVKQSLVSNLEDMKQFYDENRQEYIIDISPLIFDKIVEYYSTKKLNIPTNIHLDYYKETLEKLQIDTSSLGLEQYHQRIVPQQKTLRIFHILLEYPDSCRVAQVLHYICSMIALLSCLIVSLSLTSRDPYIDLHQWNLTDKELPIGSKSSIAHFRYYPSKFFIIDLICFCWIIIETCLRLFSSVSFYDYFSILGLFDIIGVIFHFIYLLLIGTKIKSRYNCMMFNRHLMMLNLLRKVRLVRYIRPLKYFILSLMASKKELRNLIVFISFLLAVFAPLILIIENSSLYENSSDVKIPVRREIRTMSDACYFMILLITTVGYGEIYPTSIAANLISMLASLFSLMMFSLPLSLIYRSYVSIREMYEVQRMTPTYIRYIIYDKKKFNQNEKIQQQKTIDVTEQVNEILNYLGNRSAM